MSSRTRICPIHPGRPAPHRDVRLAVHLSGRPVEVRFVTARSVGRVGQRTASPHRRHCRPPHLHQDRQHRGNQPRPRRHHGANRLPLGRSTQHGFLDFLRPRRGNTGPSRVLRHDFEFRRRPAALRPALGQRLPAQPLPRRQVPLVGRPVLYLSNPPGFTGANPAPISMPWANSTAPPPRNSATPKSLRAPPNTRWRSGCKPPFRN